MSELKVYNGEDIQDLIDNGDKIDLDYINKQFVEKSEADKVIAKLKSQKAQAEDDCAYWKTMSRKRADDNEVMAKQRADAFKRERYHKYKRCLAMARWCEDKVDAIKNGYIAP